jgi:hypothetical protein
MRAYKLTATVAFSLAAFFLSGSMPANAQALAYCKADAQRLCPGVPPGGGRLVKCLKAQANEVSIGCAKELKKLKSETKM